MSSQNNEQQDKKQTWTNGKSSVLEELQSLEKEGELEALEKEHQFEQKNYRATNGSNF